jgi:hypothetical protein
MFKHSDPYAAMEAGEVGLDMTGDFADKAIRRGFVRKVFGTWQPSLPRLAFCIGAKRASPLCFRSLSWRKHQGLFHLMTAVITLLQTEHSSLEAAFVTWFQQ